jgi:hypothetical protein
MADKKFFAKVEWGQTGGHGRGVEGIAIPLASLEPPMPIFMLYLINVYV